MAYNKISQATINKVVKRYGEGSKEHSTIDLIAECRLPYECIGELFRLPCDKVKTDVTGGLPLDEMEHSIVHNGLNVLLNTALERGLLPSRDGAIIVPILEMLLYMEQANRTIKALQSEKGGE